jgi:dihydroxyacetone kinase
MIDALHPAAVTATKNLSNPLPGSLEATAQAARDGMEASKDMIATMGRAKTLGEKSLGLPDAGAISVTIILETMRDAVQAKR